MNTGALARMECGSEVRQCNAFLGTVEQMESRPCCALLSVAAPSSRRAIPGARCGLLSRGQAARSGVLVCRSNASSGSQRVAFFKRVSPVQFLAGSVTASGLLRRPAAHRRSAFRTPLPEQVWVPAPECTARHLGVEPIRIASQGVTRADREFKIRRLEHVYESRNPHRLPRQRR